MIVNLVEKYGVVPKTVFPETVSSSASRNMNQLLMSFLRQYAHDLRSAITDGKADTKVKEMIGNMMSQVYRLLCVHLGTPPSSFSWNFADKDKKFFSFSNLTPQEFYKKHGHFDMNNYVSVIHDPRNAKNQMYSVKYLGNVVDGVRQNVRHLNVDISELRAYSKQQLEKESPVWFGCDAGVSTYLLCTHLCVADSQIQARTFIARLERGTSMFSTTRACMVTASNCQKSNACAMDRVS